MPFSSHKKRFLILTSDSGFGHRSAANSIARALAQLNPSLVEVTVVNPIFEEPTSSLLQQVELSYDRTVRGYPGWYKFAYEASDNPSARKLIENTLSKALRKNIERLISDLNPDAIATTNMMFNAPAGAAMDQLNQAIPLFTVITDLADVHALWFNSRPDRFFVGSELVRSKAIVSGIDASKIVISGIPVNPLFAAPRPSRADLRLRLGLDPDLTTLLVVGSQRVNKIFERVKALEEISHPFQLVVIAGGDKKLYRRLIRRKWKFPIVVKNIVTNMPEWMLSADLLISKAGGLIISEGMAAGLPIILIHHLPGQEEGNVQFVLDHHVGVFAEEPAEFARVVDRWLGDQKGQMKAIAENSRRLGHPDSAMIVASSLWEATAVDIRSSFSSSESLTLP